MWAPPLYYVTVPLHVTTEERKPTKGVEPTLALISDYSRPSSSAFVLSGVAEGRKKIANPNGKEEERKTKGIVGE